MIIRFQVKDWYNYIFPLLHSSCYIYNRIQWESTKSILQHIFHYLNNIHFQHILQSIIFYKCLNRQLVVNCNSSIMSQLDQSTHYNLLSITGIFHLMRTTCQGIQINTSQYTKPCLLCNSNKIIHQKIKSKYHNQYYHRKTQVRIKSQFLQKKKQAIYQL